MRIHLTIAPVLNLAFSPCRSSCRSRIATIVVLFLGTVCLQRMTLAATFNVSDAPGLRTALLASGTNGLDDVIVLAAGTYATAGTAFAFLTNEGNSLILKGASGTTRDQVVLNGGGTSQVLNFDCAGSCGAITLTGLTVQGGKSGTDGGGVRSSGSLTLSDVSFFGNSANPGYSGGAIHGGSLVAVSNSTFSNNTAGNSGGAISGVGAITASSSIFDSNTADNGGAVRGNSGVVTVTSSTFTNNMAKFGGAIDSQNGVSVLNSNFSFNQATTFGGAIVMGCCRVTVTNSVFAHNTSGSDGGAIYGFYRAIDAINSIFSDNTATTGSGGAIFGSEYVVNSTFSGNAAGSGAAIVVGSLSSIINSVFYGHTSPAISAGNNYNLYNNLIDTATDIVGTGPIVAGNVAPGITSPFVDGANGNFRLAAGSLAIDTGLDPDSTTFANLVGADVGDIRLALLMDMDGKPRPFPGTVVDIGAYEFNGPPTIPGAPTAVAATSDNASVTLTFGVPVTNGGSPITGYSAVCTSANGGFPGSNTGGPNATSIQIGGLTNGKTYTCNVAAINLVGTGPASTVPYSLTPGAIPLLLDIDGDGTPDALTDGLLVIRYLFGLRGDALIAGALGVNATRTTAAQIEAYIQSLRP